MLKFKFDKLVRDKIVDTQIATGAKPKYHTLDPDAHVAALVDKIIEEAREIIQADEDAVTSEIADVQQAVDDLIELVGITADQVAAAQQKKNEKAGAFKKGIYVEYVEVADNDPWVEYYRKNADRYPQIN